MGMGIIFGLFYVLSGTKYTSLRLTSFDMELQSLKPHDDSGGNVVIINGKPSSSSTSAVTSTNDCFWYSDNLYHLACAVLTDRPIQFHVLANRVPKMHRELFQLLDVKRCTNNNSRQSRQHKGAGWEDLARNVPKVREKLWRLQQHCQATLSEQSLSSTHTEKNKKKKKCLHLARNFNRRLQNCTDTLEQCDRVVFDDSMSFCQLWNIVQEYSTIVSPHGFQLVLPIMAHAALRVKWSYSSLIEVPRQRQPQLSTTITTATSVRIVEVRWLGYGDLSYQKLTRIFGINHTLLYGMTPNGKLNRADNDCVKHIECRKSERKRDLQCTSDTQQQLATILSSDGELLNSNTNNV
ncbi:DUF563 domain containing protein [Nitzschia inconspicua]|uniref:DUF563 domain containing protein n=1 Tax=Nitzschia inconspicua TaxID=303405 RepID=A0A9K3PIN2_9STRA|nr:DUF563 domain containing protein [Nitzschia inconspicua]